MAKIGRMFTPFSRFYIKVVRLAAPFFDKIAAQIQIAPFAGSPVEFYQSQFDFFVAAIAAPLARPGTKNRPDIVGVTASRVQQAAFPGSGKVSDCRFDKMPGAIKLVPVAQIGPAL